MLDQYINELKSKRQKLREKRKPTTKVNNTTNEEADNSDLGEEEECEEDDDDDDDYDYIEDKLLSQNNTAGGGGGFVADQKNVLQNLINGESQDKSVRKQKIWKKDMLRQDDFLCMKEMVLKLRKHRQNENGS